MSRILIIEDEIAINKMLCLNLGITGYETVSLYDGQEFLRRKFKKSLSHFIRETVQENRKALALDWLCAK